VRKHGVLHFCYLGVLYFDLGDLHRAQDFLEQAVRESQRHQEEYWEPYSRIWLGRTLARAHPSQTAEAEAQIRQGIQMADERKLRTFTAYGHHFLGDLYAGKGEREMARQSLEKAVSMYQEMGMDYWLTQAQATLDKLTEGKE
jgi:tetratricopeptide (TPR) repeat protein